MGLKDKIVKALALRYARGKIAGLRGKDQETTMGRILKALDGYKLLIAVVGIAAAKAWDMQHNGHAGDALGIVLALLGYTPSAEWATLGRDIGLHGLAIVAALHKVYKANRQMKAGATLGEALTTEGVIKQALSEGKLEGDDEQVAG